LERRLSEVEACAKRLLSHGGGGRIEAELTRISAQALKGIADVAQLLDFLKSRERESRSADLVSLLRGLARVGESEGKEAGSRTLDLLGEEPVIVAARPSYLERVFSSLLWYARDAVAGQTDKVITLRVARLATRGEVGIWWPGPPHESDGGDLLEREHSPAEDVLGLAACRSLIRSCGGEIRLISDLARGWCFDIELPLAPVAAPPPASETRSPAHPGRPLLVLVEDSDQRARQSLITLLGDKGQRALPAASMEEAIDLVKRFHFNALFCSAQGPGASWVDCLSRTRNHVDAFVVLSPGHDPALSAALPPGVAYALAKPVEPDELARLLEQIGARIGKPSR
jgi:CheY-like chemotaxis protein